MTERDDYPPGVPCWVDTLQPDPQAAVRFYGDLMGWTFEGPGTMPGDPPGQYFVARLRGRDVAGVGTQPSKGAPPAPTWNTYVSVESADDTAKKAASAGGKVVREPFDVLPAGRMAVLADPAGAVFCAWEPRDRQGAQLVSELGAWAMSSLVTPDPEGAKTFYGAVFGWKAEPMKMNGDELTLWRRPGFVGGTSEQPVPRDVVAVMMRMKPGAPGGDGPPNWLVGFWVPDADATVEQTKKLGGKVVVPPFEIPRFRQAILADPQGAVFSVSQPKRSG
jgi:predicted enzyme related to lactoylglutathione lyase